MKGFRAASKEWAGRGAGGAKPSRAARWPIRKAVEQRSHTNTFPNNEKKTWRRSEENREGCHRGQKSRPRVLGIWWDVA